MVKRIRNYAALTLHRGVNLQPGQILVIDTPLWTADFCHILMEEAFGFGARDVVIHYDDPEGERLRTNLAPENALTDVPAGWQSAASAMPTETRHFCG